MKTFNFIVEIGQSHAGRIWRAKRAIRHIAEIQKIAPKNVKLYAKFQLFNPFSVFGVDYKKTLPEYEAQLTKQQYKYLVEYGMTKGIRVFSSAFENGSVICALRIEEELYASSPMIKIASRSHKTEYLFSTISSFVNIDPKIIVSTGDIAEKKNGSVADIAGFDGQNIIPLYCVPEYPHVFTEREKEQISVRLREGDYKGVSDHSSRFDDDVFNIVKNAFADCGGDVWYERHFTDDVEKTKIDREVSIAKVDLEDLMFSLKEIE